MQYSDLTEDVMFVRWTVHDFIIGLLWLCLCVVCTLSQGSVSVHAEISSIFAVSLSPLSLSLFIFGSLSRLPPHFVSSFLLTSQVDFSSLLGVLMLILNIALITYNVPNGLSQLTVIRHLSQTQLIKCLCRRSQESRDHAWHIISLWMPVITRLPETDA